MPESVLLKLGFRYKSRGLFNTYSS